ncbi:hypothetical protein B0H63DRAFT_396681 [Podospora didyma]|uniref:Xylanolytic transcriptional activator regulatory domain-containing protein n=1 Tax=Podospora didyma TaxID=330526 RepID=A0AAE0TVE4_9PEZI|nr:hypothetical protein B0H63DRAFT_396681 [Podospora didyma]
MTSSVSVSKSAGASESHPPPRRQVRRESIHSAHGSDPGPIKRARQSCDACKNRKTKVCSGPCRYCASIGGTCSTSVRLQRRPYYRVSEEEYQCCMRLLRHFIPNVTLDLKTMRAMIAQIEQGADIIGGGTASSSSTSSSSSFSSSSSSTAMAAAAASVIETEESEVLQEERGCMIIGARGSYTYVGADSSVRFANAVAQAAPITNPRRHQTDPAIIMIPLTRSRLPPEPPESLNSGGDYDSGIYLPPREICQVYAMRFFEELQSIYWFYSPEQFFTLVDKTYADHGASSSASWLCSLYCIFAICSARIEGNGSSHHFNGNGNGGSGGGGDEKTSSDYLALAKSLGLQVCDEADTDAVRALSLLSLALHSSCFTVTAYLIIGMTVRMAYTLGLHRNIAAGAAQQDSVSRARVHRLWWTIYLLDQEIAIQLGYPCAIVDDVVGLQTPPACESILDPGRQTPHGYQAVCVALVKLKKKVSHTLYVAPALLSARKVVPFSAVTGCIGDLRDWLAKLPPHLCWSSGMAPSHGRAVAVLHLRYWLTLIHVQRPFLLYAVTRGEELSGDKRRWYEELSGLCLDAAEKSVGIIKRMRDHGLLSSLVLFDSQCIHDLVHVFLLGRQHYKAQQRGAMASEGLETCMAAMRGMEPIGWCDKILPELTAQVAASTSTPTTAEAETSSTHVENGGTVGGGDDGVHARDEEEVVRSPLTGGAAAGFSQQMDDALHNAFFNNFQDFE